MSCTYHTPHSPYDGLANSWFCIKRKTGEPADVELIIPDCTPGLMYIQRGSFCRKSHLGTETFSAGKVYLFGQKSRSVTYDYGVDGMEAFGVKLHPASLNMLFGISAVEIADSCVDIGAIVQEPDKIAHQLTANRFHSDLGPNSLPYNLQVILKAIHQSNGLASISKIADKFNTSYKSIERLFQRHIGLSPKLYTRIIRFNQSVRLAHSELPRLTDVAYQSGYSDQNHFIKEFKFFTGKLPGEVLRPQREVLERNQITYLSCRSF